MTVTCCPYCNQLTRHTFVQFGRTYATCENTSLTVPCPRVGLTLTIEAHDALTDSALAEYSDQIRSYRESRQK